MIVLGREWMPNSERFGSEHCAKFCGRIDVNASNVSWALGKAVRKIGSCTKTIASAWLLRRKEKRGIRYIVHVIELYQKTL